MIPWWIDIDICKEAVNQRMDAIKGISDMKWDMIIIDLFFAPCGYIIAEQANSPYLLLSTSDIVPSSKRHMAHPTPVAGAMSNVAEFDPKKFMDRFLYVLIWEVIDSFTDAIINQLMKRTLAPALSPGFSYEKFDAESDLSISAYPDVWELPKPYLPDYISGGDMACKPAKSLPAEYAEFVNDPRSKGTVLAAFGHVVSWSTTKNETIYTIYETFRQLSDYRFIWQYNGPALPLSPNIKISDWIPQTDILYHPKTKAFISHMGLKSALESLCAKVPFVALPVYAEQPLNTQLLIGRHKLGVYLNKKKLSTNDMVAKIQEVLENGQYKQRVEKMAVLMADKPISPKKLMDHWIQFAIRHHPDLHRIKPRGRKMNFAKRWMIDVILMGILAFVVVAIVATAFSHRMLKMLL